MKAILTRYHGPTNTRGSRYSATDSDRNRISIPADYSLNSEGNHDKAAMALCVKMGWVQHPLMRGGTPTGNVYVFDDPSNRLEFHESEIQQGYANARKKAGDR
jgi:hypothetical protein